MARLGERSLQKLSTAVFHPTDGTAFTGSSHSWAWLASTWPVLRTG